MKYIRLTIILVSLLSLAKAQEPCKTILLKDGHRYNGIILAISSRVIKFENCNVENRPIVTIYRRDVEDNNSYTQLKEKMRLQRFEKKIRPLDTIKYIHFGIIPYQFLTRSLGLYLRYDFKNSSLEYRPSYTYATNLEPNAVFTLPFYDNFYFQGINNSFIWYVANRGRTQIGLILSYKYWWHGKESIVNDNSQISGKEEELHLSEIRSTVMNGFSMGAEFVHYRKSYKNFDFNFFWNATLTYFNSYSHVYSIDKINWYSVGNPSVPSTYPYTETKSRIYFNLTCGFKLGFKKPLKN